MTQFKLNINILPMWMLATSYNVLENDSSESRASVNYVQPSAAHCTNKHTNKHTNKQIQSENIHSISKSKQSRKAKGIKQTNKPIKQQSKIQNFSYLQNLVG